MDNIDLEKVLKQDGHEDYIEYLVFPSPDQSQSTNAAELLLQYNAAIQSLAQDYIWQKDSIILQESQWDLHDESEAPTSDANSSQSLCFHGITRFGDNIEDEWFVTWVLLQLTKEFSGSVVRVVDNDGEFLLIEAADNLPKWAESDEACLQRVYLFNGNVHLIPKSTKSGAGSGVKTPIPRGTPSLLTAVSAVRENPGLTIATGAINRSIKDRIGNYPAKMLQNFHHSNLVLPPKLAAILSKHPEFIAPAVNAFYYRDPIELKTSRLMKNFKPGDCLVKSRVRFTKCLYAMLSKQEFLPDPKTGWGFPRPASAEFKAHSLGAKLTIGFEIILSKATVEPPPSLSASNNNDMGSSAKWQLYVSSLKKHGYFKGFLEGSKPYQDLLNKATEFYREGVAVQSHKNKNGQNTKNNSINSLANKIFNIVQTIPVDADKFKADALNLPPDEDELWLNITQENLETLLEKQFRSSGGAGASFGSPKPEDIPTKLKEFMSTMAELEGIDLPSSSRTKPRSRSELKAVAAPANIDASAMDVPMDPLDFRADDFVSAMDKLLLDLGKPDNDWDESEEDDMSYSDDEAITDIMNKHKFKKDSKLFQLMGEMDEELAGTDVGKTFTTASTTQSNIHGAGDGDDQKDEDEFGDVEEFQPVNIDINALTNMIKSFQSQEFPTGPSVNLLKSVGFDLSKATATPTTATTNKKSTASNISSTSGINKKPANNNLSKTSNKK